MKLLVVGPDIRDIRKVKNFTGIYAYYLCRELRERGVILHFIDGKAKQPLQYLADVDGRGCDHVLALGLRWFTHQPAGCSAILKTKVPGAVTQLHDGVVHEYWAPLMNAVDTTFMFRDDAVRTRDWGRYASSYHYIGWAADPDYLYPEQNSSELRILVDHCYYKNVEPGRDITEALTVDATMFAHTGSWMERFKSVKVRRLINGGAESVGIDDPPLKAFDRLHVPFPDIAREYRRTHVFLPTHRESVGLTCLELAYCGALIAAPAGMIYADRLATMRHIEFEGVRAPWGKILEEIDIMASAEIARAQTWGKVTDRLLQWFEDYR